jgi:hypothetical protein
MRLSTMDSESSDPGRLTAVGKVEKHPERLHEDFIVPAAAVMIATWPCRK